MRPAPLDRLRATRRGFLTLAGGGAALATLGQLRALPAGAAEESAGARFFGEHEREVLTQVVERMVATGEPEEPAVRDSAAVATIDRLCRGLDPSLTAPLPWLLRLVDWSPWVFELTPSRFTGLSDEGKDDVLRGWMTSRFELRRLGFQALRNLAFLGWYSQPRSWPAIGYRGPLLDRGGSAG